MASHSAADYKANTGVRARHDMSANARALPTPRMTDDDLVRVAEHLAGHARDNIALQLPPALCGRLADAILETVNRRVQPMMTTDRPGGG